MSATGWIDMLERIGPISSGRAIAGGRFGATASVRDWAESNDIIADATNLYVLSGSDVELDGLSLHTAADIDWYRFTLGANGTAGNNISVAGTQASLSMMVLDGAGISSVASNDGGGNSVSLAGLPAGDYLFSIKSKGASVRDYQLVINAPAATASNRLGDNGTSDKAYPLGMVGNQLTMQACRCPAARRTGSRLKRRVCLLRSGTLSKSAARLTRISRWRFSTMMEM